MDEIDLRKFCHQTVRQKFGRSTAERIAREARGTAYRCFWCQAWHVKERA